MRPKAFVSHAHSDHTGNHREVILSKETARFMQARLGGRRVEYPLAFRERTELPGLPGLQIELLPAGHIFGSAQIFLQSEAGSLLYTGDFKLREGLSTEKTEWCQADTLIMETTFARPRYRFPDAAGVLEEMVSFCRTALEDGVVPVIYSYSLGKSQEIIWALIAAGLTPMLHRAVFAMTELYRELCPGYPAGYLPYREETLAGCVLVCPPNVARMAMVQKLPKKRTAVMTGWALDPGAKFRYRVDAAFPLSDHADYDDLLRYVELVKPQRVLTLHGFAADFASDLRERGVEAWSLGQDDQLNLPLWQGQKGHPSA